MVDIFSEIKRSQIMKSIKSSGNKSTELKLIKYFESHHIIGWRRNYPVKGHPDFVFLSKKIAVFVDGCFWHGHDCRKLIPQQNQSYWEKKRERNMKHDENINAIFKSRGWTVVRIWECELRKKNESILQDKLKVLIS